MNFMFVEAKHSKPAALPKIVLDKIKKQGISKLAVYSSVQFLEHAKLIREQLQKSGIEVVTSKPKRTCEIGQILGCDCYENSLNLSEYLDGYLYIGDGRFHPQALLLMQKSREKKDRVPVHCYDPVSKKLKALCSDEVKKMLKKYRSSLKRFLMADSIGVLVSTKPGQEHINQAQILQAKYNKKFYVFLFDTLSLNELENFPYIKCWVNTACPRIGFDDSLNTHLALVNANDAMNAQRLIDQLKAQKQANC